MQGHASKSLVIRKVLHLRGTVLTPFAFASCLFQGSSPTGHPTFPVALQMTQFVENMTKQLETKGKEINAYREEHNIRIRGEEDSKTAAAESDSKSGGGGVLVANSS